MFVCLRYVQVEVWSFVWWMCAVDVCFVSVSSWCSFTGLLVCVCVCVCVRACSCGWMWPRQSEGSPLPHPLHSRITIKPNVPHMEGFHCWAAPPARLGLGPVALSLAPSGGVRCEVYCDAMFESGGCNEGCHGSGHRSGNTTSESRCARGGSGSGWGAAHGPDPGLEEEGGDEPDRVQKEREPTTREKIQTLQIFHGRVKQQSCLCE